MNACMHTFSLQQMNTSYLVFGVMSLNKKMPKKKNKNKKMPKKKTKTKDVFRWFSFGDGV